MPIKNIPVNKEVTDEHYQLVYEAFENEGREVERIYHAPIANGMGDFYHMLDRASANQRLPEEFREKFPEKYVLMVVPVLGDTGANSDPEVKEARMIEIMKNLPIDHPMHWHEDEYLRKVSFSEYKNVPSDGKNHVSYVVSGFGAGSKAPFEVSNYEFSPTWIDENSYSDLEVIRERWMGFSKFGYGVFVKDEIVGDDDLLKCFNLAKPEEKKLLCQILGIDLASNQIFTQNHIEEFRNNNSFLPIYMDADHGGWTQELLQKAVIGSELVGEKNLVVLSNHPSVVGVDGKMRVVAKNTFISEPLYKALKSLSPAGIYPFSGDKTFEDAINLNLIPSGLDHKTSHLDDLMDQIGSVDDSELSPEKKTLLVKYFTIFKDIEGFYKTKPDPRLDQTKKTKALNELKSMLGSDLLDAWKSFNAILKEHHNYFDIVPIMELQSLALYNFRASENPDAKLLALFTPEEKLSALYCFFSNISGAEYCYFAGDYVYGETKDQKALKIIENLVSEMTDDQVVEVKNQILNFRPKSEDEENIVNAIGGLILFEDIQRKNPDLETLELWKSGVSREELEKTIICFECLGDVSENYSSLKGFTTQLTQSNESRKAPRIEEEEEEVRPRPTVAAPPQRLEENRLLPKDQRHF